MGTDIHVMGLQAEVRENDKKIYFKNTWNFPNLMKQITHKEAHPNFKQDKLRRSIPRYTNNHKGKIQRYWKKSRKWKRKQTSIRTLAWLRADFRNSRGQGGNKMTDSKYWL